jgi:hypothetical protein
VRDPVTRLRRFGADAELELRVRVALICGLAVPGSGLSVILWHACAAFVDIANFELRSSVPLLGACSSDCALRGHCRGRKLSLSFFPDMVFSFMHTFGRISKHLQRETAFFFVVTLGRQHFFPFLILTLPLPSCLFEPSLSAFILYSSHFYPRFKSPGSSSIWCFLSHTLSASAEYFI